MSDLNTCPVCAKTYTASTEFPFPCGPCWRAMPPDRRAPYLRALRLSGADAGDLRHLDPVAYAPKTLQSYIQHLEHLLAERGPQ